MNDCDKDAERDAAEERAEARFEGQQEERISRGIDEDGRFRNHPDGWGEPE